MATKKPLPTPLDTTMKKRWRWDRFADAGQALDWYTARKQQGYHVQLRGTYVAWDQDRKPVKQQRPSYPRVRFDWCNHCGERREFTRTGPGGPDPRDAYRARGFKQYSYTETPPHACPGLLAEHKALRAAGERMTRDLSRILRGMK
jgi:hypothetical protein